MNKCYLIISLLLSSFSLNVAAQLIPPFVFQKNWYNKRMADVFEDLSKKKLLKAEQGWQSIEKKFDKEKDELTSKASNVSDLLYPLWQLSHCILKNAREGRYDPKGPLTTAYDPWDAYTTLKEIMGKQQMIAYSNTFFNDKKLPFSVASIKTHIEKNLVDTVRTISTEQAYDRLIDLLFNYNDIMALKKEREQLAFNSVIVSSSVAECERYMKKYYGDDGNHLNMVTHRRDSLAFVQMDTTVAGCQHYLASYPKSAYIEQVTRMLHRYEFNQLPHSAEACQEYLDKYPTSEYAQKVKELKVSYTFDQMKERGTIDAYRKFLDDYRNSRYAKDNGLLGEAQNLLKQALLKKYISRDTSLDSLKEIVGQGTALGVEVPEIASYLYNLTYLPTSAFMNGCAGLTGAVHIITNSQHGDTSEESMFYNKQGLLTEQSNSKSNLYYSYEYAFDAVHGYQLAKRTDQKGHTVTFTTKYDSNGSIAEIAGNDGSKIRYSYNGNNLEKVTYLQGTVTDRTDFYGYRNQKEKTERSGNVVVYEYNSKLDIISMSKKRGSTVMSTTTYEYSYPSDDAPWVNMLQYNDGQRVFSKSRSYERPQVAPHSMQSVSSPKQYNTAGKDSDNEVFEKVEQMPSFHGGDAALMQYLSTHLKYPVVAEENGIQGRVVSTFVVERDGSITDIRVVKSVDPSLEKEAIRLIKSMPKWIPGKQDGKAVRVEYTVPITFRLQ